MEQPAPEFFQVVGEHNHIPSQVHTTTMAVKYFGKDFSSIVVSGGQMAQKILQTPWQNLTYN